MTSLRSRAAPGKKASHSEDKRSGLQMPSQPLTLMASLHSWGWSAHEVKKHLPWAPQFHTIDTREYVSNTWILGDTFKSCVYLLGNLECFKQRSWPHQNLFNFRRKKAGRCSVVVKLDHGFMLVICCNERTVWSTMTEVCRMLLERTQRGIFKVKREDSLDTEEDHKSHFKQLEEGTHNIVTFLAGKQGWEGVKNRLMRGSKNIYIYTWK